MAQQPRNYLQINRNGLDAIGTVGKRVPTGPERCIPQLRDLVKTRNSQDRDRILSRWFEKVLTVNILRWVRSEPYLVDVFEVLNYRHVGILADEALLLRLRRFLLLGVPT
eukprot:7834918-Pyramimonas_sp.AAC.1